MSSARYAAIAPQFFAMVIRSAQRERVQREGRVHARDRREEAASRDKEVADVVGAAVAVGEPSPFALFPMTV